jgi:CheY-like chemotaxis protein
MTVASAGSPLRVLVVDGDVNTATSTALLFQMQGHQAKRAHNRPEAIARTKAYCPHLILLDIGTPKVDGYEVARALRNIQCVEESTIVAVTSYGYSLDRRRCVEAGFDFHLTKPVDSDVLGQLALLCQASIQLSEERQQLELRHIESLGSLVYAAIQMANTFLDVATNTTSEKVRERCVAKAKKMHRQISGLVQRKAHWRMDLTAGLDELNWRCQQPLSDLPRSG